MKDAEKKFTGYMAKTALKAKEDHTDLTDTMKAYIKILSTKKKFYELNKNEQDEVLQLSKSFPKFAFLIENAQVKYNHCIRKKNMSQMMKKFDREFELLKKGQKEKFLNQIIGILSQKGRKKAGILFKKISEYFGDSTLPVSVSHAVRSPEDLKEKRDILEPDVLISEFSKTFEFVADIPLKDMQYHHLFLHRQKPDDIILLYFNAKIPEICFKFENTGIPVEVEFQKEDIGINMIVLLVSQNKIKLGEDKISRDSMIDPVFFGELLVDTINNRGELQTRNIFVSTKDY